MTASDGGPAWLELGAEIELGSRHVRKVIWQPVGRAPPARKEDKEVALLVEVLRGSGDMDEMHASLRPSDMDSELLELGSPAWLRC